MRNPKIYTGKYEPLYRHLCDQSGREWSASFAEIEKVLGFSLPKSAHNYNAWWANNEQMHSHARAWLVAGWQTFDVNLTGKRVGFRRT